MPVFSAALLFVVLILHTLFSFAASSEWVKTPYGQARLLVAGVLPQQETFTAGLEVEMEPGWKTYWRTPGAAGIPPKLIWEGSSGINNIELHYPAPHRLDFQGLQLYGYEDRVIFPLTITRDLAVSEPDLKVDARLLICKELCVPASFPMSLTLDKANQATDIDSAFAIDQFKALIPLPAAVANIPPARITLDAEQKLLQVDIDLPKNYQLEDLFPEVQPEPELDAPVWHQLEQRGEQNPQADQAESGKTIQAQFSIQRKQLPDTAQPASVVIRTNLGAYELNAEWQTLVTSLTPLPKSLSTAPSTQTYQTQSTGAGLWLMLLMALAGGLILNLMPCVLPVLSIKVLHLIKHQELNGSQMRTSFFATAMGIISSFAALAGVLIALKASGQAIGWGIQFQQPLFIAALTIAVVLFAANLWGRFEFSLPGFIANLGTSKAGSSTDTQNNAWISSFAQGALATLLATPCSAPFLGTAVGFAFAQDAPQLLAIFITMGIGLALPYLLLMLRPQWVYKLPKPGPWMITLKKILSVSLLATASWLLWVLADLVALWGVGLFSGLLLIWWLSTRIRAVFWALPLVAWLSISPMPMAAPPAPSGGEVEDQINWKAFKPDQIAQHVADGKLVFVDITARWCVSCVANKIAVIHTGKVQDTLNAPGIIAMQGDWTRPNAVISDFLNKHQRFGIPFNAVYGPGAPDGILLSEILSQDELLHAIEQAR